MRRRLMLLSFLTATACSSRSTDTATAPVPAATVTPPAAPAQPATLRYAAGTGRYRVESQINVTQEVMGTAQATALTANMLFSTALAEDAGNLLLTATVDSITIGGSAPGVDAGALASARGRTIRTRFTPVGRIVPMQATADSADPMTIQLTRSVRELLGALPPSTAAGTTWTDTITDASTLPGGGGSMSTRSIRNHRVIGWESRDNRQALRITTTGAFTIAGAGEIQGAAIQLDGSGNATVDRWVSTDGIFLGMTSSDSTNMTVLVSSVGMSIPVRQTQRVTVTRLP
jgi:hypothetical protein